MKKKNNKIILLLVLLLAITIGFAALATTLKINGTANIGKNSWNIYWDNIANKKGVTPETDPTITSYNNVAKTLLTWEVDLDTPGDYFEFEVDAVNAGSLDAEITGIESKYDDTSVITTTNGVLVEDDSVIPSYIKYSVKYKDNGNKPALGDKLLKASDPTDENTFTRKTYVIHVEYDKDAVTNAIVNNMNENGESHTFTLEVTYGQATAPSGYNFQLGEYFTLVPDVENYTIPTGLTGYENYTTYTQDVLHPSELTLWRVIDVHQDGTVDAVSEYTSSTKVAFHGVRGYQNFVGGLQTIAEQYAKSGYTVGTRMIGYDGQTSTISDTSSFDHAAGLLGYPSSISAPKPTTGTGEEFYGGIGGDTLYLKDIQLMRSVYGTDSDTYGASGLKTHSISDEYNTVYWLASREYKQESDWSGAYEALRGITVWNDEITHSSYFIILYENLQRSPNYQAEGDYYSVRPIITLKSGVTISSGTGTKSDPYIFN